MLVSRSVWPLRRVQGRVWAGVPPPTTTTNGDRSEERLPMHHRAVGRRLDADLPLGWGEVVR